MADVHWLEVSLTVNGELAEAVAEVLDRFVTNGVVLESGVTYSNDEDEGTVFGPVRVFGYLLIDEHIEENRQRVVEALWHLSQIQALPEPSFREIQDENWMAAWKKHYHPIPIGKRLLILPAWIEQEDPNRLAVRIDPSMAFGTGTHPTTQLCMEMVEKYTRPGEPVIDVGCGSGILSIGALELGASRALSVDIDLAAIRSTRENAESNGVSGQLETGQGSVLEILQGQFSLKRSPLVLANILAPVIIRLFEVGLADLLSDDGVIVLSGILVEQSGGVEAAARQHGLYLIETLQSSDWVALAFKK
ncbi:MAG TPA: 50S ribosomal protein L11 methyltransferase [Anaerolineaceae bacterium]|nr:50S ribosomal protein L11 methyltransferase [Anaerolineaceae bacterium]